MAPLSKAIHSVFKKKEGDVDIFVGEADPEWNVYMYVGISFGFALLSALLVYSPSVLCFVGCPMEVS